MLTPLDIENREFKRTMGGYNRDDVEDFMGILLNDYEILYKQNFEMRERIKALESGLAKDVKAAPEPTVSPATTEDSDKLLENARMQAAKLVNDAQSRANQIITEANVEIERLNRCYFEARKKMEEYREYMKNFMQAQIAAVSEVIEPGNETDE